MVDTIQLVGKLVEGNPGRDAIHVAVVPVTSDDGIGLAAGMAIGWADPVDHERVSIFAKEIIGVVDPFLKGHVLKGQRFWMFLSPATITSLRHVWTHPAFPEEVKAVATTEWQGDIVRGAEEWLRNYAHEVGIEVHLLVGTALENYDSEYLHFDGHDAHGDISPEFWHQLEIYSGKKIDKKPPYFSCSC